jgi:hypothetical protein
VDLSAESKNKELLRPGLMYLRLCHLWGRGRSKVKHAF